MVHRGIASTLLGPEKYILCIRHRFLCIIEEDFDSLVRYWQANSSISQRFWTKVTLNSLSGLRATSHEVTNMGMLSGRRS
jgi:hypothetical protein